jgi:nitrogen regulatory protein PII-like uncharacterized protein
LRNAIVHGYGGLVEASNVEKVESAMRDLQITGAFVGGRRIRLSPDNLLDFQEIVERVIDEIR